MFTWPSRTVLWLTALILGAFTSQSAAQLELNPILKFLPSPVELLQAEPDIVLSREEAAQVLDVVRSAHPNANKADLARQYGVPSESVKLLSKTTETYLYRVELTNDLVHRAPLRPKSIQVYRVRSGDTVSSIAARFGLRVVDLLGANLDRRSLDRLKLGDLLNIPTRETGLLVRIKAGQTALGLIAGYGAYLLATARANDVLPTELQEGDEVLLPGIQAHGFEQQLLAQREAERRAAAAQAKQQQFERFLAWQKDRQREKLEEQYRRQEQYEAYLAWKNSPERQRAIAALERQAQYEEAQAQARAQEAREAAQAAARRAVQARQRQQAVVRQASVRVEAITPSAQGGEVSWPMRGFRLTSRFGERDIAFHRQVFHGGIDLAAPYGTPVYAASAGMVTQSGYGGYGLNVLTSSGSRTLVYGHLSRTAVYAGQSVDRGQLIGYVGCTGICTGPHLHFEIRVAGQAVNPLAYLP